MTEHEHDPRCRDGWVDIYDGVHPIPCPTCRPDLTKCEACGCTWRACEVRAWSRGRASCCSGCTHARIWPRTVA